MSPSQHCNRRFSIALRLGPVLAICLVFSLFCDATLARDRYTASEVSVALLYNVTKFVRWPDGSFDEDDSPMKVCTFPAPDYRAPLHALEKRRVRSHPIQLVEVQRADPVAELDCHVWFFTSADEAYYRETLGMLRARGVLTVGNFRDFAEHGGMLSLVKGRKRVNIRINATTSARAGLEFNAQLLELATVFAQEEEVAQQ